MPTINVTDLTGTVHQLAVDEGKALMEPLRDANLVDAICGGAASCGTCPVFVAEKWLESTGERTEDEGYMLEALEDEIEVRPSSRLACQISVTAAHDGIEMEIAPQL
jgi:2Fe-2S ferredoxin